MAPRPQCKVCGSKQWHKEPSSGLIACNEGHVLQNYRNETTEMDEFGAHAMKKRTLKSQRQFNYQGKKTLYHYHGKKARYHYFQCLQWLLRKQIEVLIDLWKLPPAFETVCRDVWALHLNLLPVPPSAEPLYHAQEEAGLTDLNRLGSDKKGKGKEQFEGTIRIEGDDDVEREEEDIEDEDDVFEDNDASDPDLEALMRMNSQPPSESDSEDEKDPTTNKAPKPPPALKRWRGLRGQFEYDVPSTTISVLYVALWTMRIPLLYRDLLCVIEKYELPYLDLVRLLPPELSTYLNRYTVRALSPPCAPTLATLNKQASRLARLMYQEYGIFTPEANAAPILWRSIRCLGGTPEVYALTKTLSRTLSLPLTLHSSLAPSLERDKEYEQERHRYDNIAPEVGFVCVTIVVLKLLYGLDGIARIPEVESDPASRLPALADYLDIVRSLEERDAIRTAVTDMPVETLSDEALDNYLAFCEKALLPGGAEGDLLSIYFPLAHIEARSVVDHHDEATSSTVQATAVGEAGLRPGQKFPIYLARDAFGELPQEYGAILQRAAWWTRASSEHLERVIENYERRLVRWWERKGRDSRRSQRKRDAPKSDSQSTGSISSSQ